MISVDADNSVTIASTITEQRLVRRDKRTRKSSRDKNTEQIAENKASVKKEKRRADALDEGLELLCSDDIKKKRTRNKNCISKFQYTHGGGKYSKLYNQRHRVDGDTRSISRITLVQYKVRSIENQRRVGAIESIPYQLLDTMRLHIKVLQLSKHDQASGQVIKGKLTAAATGTKYEDFDSDWVWRRICEM